MKFYFSGNKMSGLLGNMSSILQGAYVSVSGNKFLLFWEQISAPCDDLCSANESYLFNLTIAGKFAHMGIYLNR